MLKSISVTNFLCPHLNQPVFSSGEQLSHNVTSHLQSVDIARDWKELSFSRNVQFCPMWLLARGECYIDTQP